VGKRTRRLAREPWQSGRPWLVASHFAPAALRCLVCPFRRRHRISFLAHRLACTKPLPTTAMTTPATELQLARRDTISGSQDEPDFDTPANIREAAIAAIHRGERGVRRADRAEARGLRPVQARERARRRAAADHGRRAASGCCSTRSSARSRRRRGLLPGYGAAPHGAPVGSPAQQRLQVLCDARNRIGGACRTLSC
jgi:hypothetical protein